MTGARHDWRGREGAFNSLLIEMFLEERRRDHSFELQNQNAFNSLLIEMFLEISAGGLFVEVN